LTPFKVINLVGETREFSHPAEAQDALLLEMRGRVRSLQALEGLWESNLDTIGAIEDVLGRAAGAFILGAAYAEAKSVFEQHPGNRQDRPVAGAQQSDPARGATHSAETGQTEHPEGGPQATSNERSKPQELQAAGAATPVPAKETPNTPDNRPRDEPKQAAHVQRDAAFWSQKKYVLPETARPKELLYYLGQYLKQCRDQFDVNAIEIDNADRFKKELSENDQREAREQIDYRRKEIG
jgi:hypothetical protein